jgi:hypothetical protein
VTAVQALHNYRHGEGWPSDSADRQARSTRNSDAGSTVTSKWSAGWVDQDKDVDLGPGQQLYVKIVSLGSWGVSVSGSKNFARDTFYAWLIPQDVALIEIARDRSGI